MSFNLSPNFTLSSAKTSCFSGGDIHPECIIKEFCPQLPAYFSKVALWLLIAYLVIDFLIPLFFARIMPKINLDRFYADNPKILDLRLKDNQAKLIYFLKDRLLFTFAILAGYILYFFHI